jgi:hypothetical protein
LLEDETWKRFETVEARIPVDYWNYTTVELEGGNGLYYVEKEKLAGKKFYFYGSIKYNNGYRISDQTDNLEVLTDGRNLYTITKYGEDTYNNWTYTAVNAEGDWSKTN